MSKVQQISRRTVYENRWMRVHEDRVQFPDESKGVYGVVDKEDFALIIPRHADGRFQLVEQYRYPVGARYWEFPQGSWETTPGTPPETVAQGELQEETGFFAKTLSQVGHLFEAYGFCNQGFHIFLATDLIPAPADKDHEEQDLVTKAFTDAEVKQMILSSQIKDAPTVAAFGLLTLLDI